MNKRIAKKKTTKFYNTKKERERNRKLCHRFPFLIPRDYIGNLCPTLYGKAYDYTLADWFPDGWWKAFGLELCEDIRADLIKNNYLYDFRIEDIKEKYGELRIYTGSIPRNSDVWEIIEDYTFLSRYICMHCGKLNVPMINWHGWFSVTCEDCYTKICEKNKREGWCKNYAPYSEVVCYDQEFADELPLTRTYTRYSKETGEQTITRDLSDIVARITKKRGIQK